MLTTSLVSRLVFLLILSSLPPAFGQVAPVPPNWRGVWQLVPSRSTFDSRMPAILGQTLTIDADGESLTLTGDTTLPDGRHVPEVTSLRLDGNETTIPGGIEVVFKRIDDVSFEVIVMLPTVGAGVNRFVFSADGKTLVETKTQTLRGATSTSVLNFERQ